MGIIWNTDCAKMLRRILCSIFDAHDYKVLSTVATHHFRCHGDTKGSIKSDMAPSICRNSLPYSSLTDAFDLRRELIMHHKK